MASESSTTPPSSLRASTWTTRVLLGGLGCLLIWRASPLLGYQWYLAIPAWLLLLVTAVLPELFLLVYPLVTRRQELPSRFRLPSLKRLAIESAIAVPIVIGCFVLLAVIQSIVTQLRPETSLTPEAYRQMGQSTGSVYLYGMLLTLVSLGPIAEEVFFRGFLFNALRNRMPMVVAILLQSVIFGFVHFYTTQVVVTAFLGLVLALVYCWRKTILTPIFVHIGYNSLFAASVLLAMHAYANGPVLGVLSHQSETECVIEIVAPNSPAEQAGLLPGDAITHVDRQPVQNHTSLVATLASYAPGDVVVISIVRDGETREIEVRLARMSSLSRR